eukprot:TRINITY_DN25266_c0_g1_i2.p1 TRINITY_DN25266_c0_g1~~TRINITY_DN25266_c0_g1_i2.p1  ORF type:complete len:404 (+),score=112.71 TRINITY_DN25266_c0_g1_i2:137-1348(+)
MLRSLVGSEMCIRDSSLSRLFAACTSSDLMDLQQFAQLIQTYDGSLSNDQVVVSFEHLSQGTDTIDMSQFVAWGRALFDQSPLPETLVGLEELIALAEARSSKIYSLPDSSLVEMAASVLATGAVAQIRSALQSSPEIERKAAAAVVGIHLHHEHPGHQTSPTRLSTGALVDIKGSVLLQRPCENLCNRPAEVYCAGLGVAMCVECSHTLHHFPVVKRMESAGSLVVPAARLTGEASMIACAINEITVLELHQLILQNPLVFQKLERAMAMLPLPSFVTKPINLQSEMFKLTTKNAWQMRRFVLEDSRISYFEDNRLCWSTPLARIRRIRRIQPLAADMTAGSVEKEFQFGLLVTPLDGPEYEKVVRASDADQQMEWMKALHNNICLIPTKLRAVPQSLSFDF